MNQMNDATAAALNRINRNFYRLFSRTFSETRSRPWDGWQRVVDSFRHEWRLHEQPPLVPSILDVGCGNGRFGIYLSQHLPHPYRYLGVDASADLLSEARQRLASESRGQWELLELDLLSGDVGAVWRRHAFHFIAVFGVLHHLPGIERRRQLLAALAGRLAPRGVLALSFWQFAARARFRRRIIPWPEHNLGSDEPIDVDQLEPGDFLLAWGQEPSARRYCHYASPQEAAELVGSLGLTKIVRFRADGESGELNLYYLLQAGD